MAWISVYDTVDGPKLRDLRKNLRCNSFEALGILNYLWLWGLENADKDGKIISADEDDIARYLYGKGSGCKLDTGAIVAALIDTGWIDKDGDDLYLHDWDIWQEQWYKARERRESDAKRKRESRRRSPGPARIEVEDVRGLSVGQSADGPEGIPEEACTDEEELKTPKYSVGFEEFWKVYPRKIGKGEANKKYQARRKDGFSDDELLAVAKNYSAFVKKNHTEAQYIKHAKTFLSDSLPFLDFLPKKEDAVPAEVTQDGNPFAEYGGGPNGV